MVGWDFASKGYTHISSKIGQIHKPFQPGNLKRFLVWSLGQEHPLAEGMATHSSILTWRIPWTEEPGGLQSIESPRVTHDWSDSAHTHTHTHTHLHFLTRFAAIHRQRANENENYTLPWSQKASHMRMKLLWRGYLPSGSCSKENTLSNLPSMGSRLLSFQEAHLSGKNNNKNNFNQFFSLVTLTCAGGSSKSWPDSSLDNSIKFLIILPSTSSGILSFPSCLGNCHW